MKTSFRRLILGSLQRVIGELQQTERGVKRRRSRGSQSLASLQPLEFRTLLAAPLVADVLKGTAGTGVVGTVYDDLDSNGTKSPGENGVSGYVVYLDLDNSGTLNTDAVGTLEPSAVTNRDGDYVIDRVVPGTYRVGEVLQAGWTPTAMVSQDTVVTKDKQTRADFFNFSGGDLEGTVWNDLNADGVRATDPTTGAFTEPGLEGWQVYLDLNTNRTFDPTEPTTLTDANGHYSFTNLAAGDYEVTEIPPAGWDVSPTFDTKQTAAVVARQTVVQDFANFSLTNGSIHGTVWNDVNGNGIRETDPTTGAFTEPGLKDWTVYLDLNNNRVADPTEPTSTTDGNGNYSFSSVPAGDYEVTEVLPAGWSPSSTFDIRQTVSVISGEASTARDFANFTVLNGSIRGEVWNDLYRDGVRNTGPTGAFTDPGLANWTVYLDLNRNNLADSTEPTTLTDANGAYRFADLQVGDYEVREILPTGWEVTVGHSDNQTATVYSGAETVARDFANFNVATATPGTVQGVVWDDQNGNGVRDRNPASGAYTDPGLAGRVIFVDANGNGIQDPAEPNATSAADGAYSISGVLPGTVRLLEAPLAGWHPTAPISGSRTIALRNAETVTGQDFGNAALHDSTIRGTVYADTSKDGVRNPGEHGLAGLTVYLDTNNNGVLDPAEPQTTTSADQFYTPAVDEAGTYSFTHLATGAYTVRTIVTDKLSATPTAELSHTITLTAAEDRFGIDTAAVFRANEIHGVRFDDANGNHKQDPGEVGTGGATLFIDTNRNNTLDTGEPTTVSQPDGSYAFAGLVPGAYVVRQVLGTGSSATYPGTVGGTLWPTGTSNASVGNVTPGSITTSLGVGETYRQSVSITLPNTGALTNLVDVFLLFDDTGSFVNNSPIVRSAFPTIISQLQSSLPGIDLGFGVGRFEEYANFASEYATGRPFILNQPIMAANTPGYMASIQAALNRTTPGYGGDQPETDFEALYQLVTGKGFDGNNNGSVLDSGAAGLVSTQLNPGSSGDVPSFASFQADASGSVMAAAGNIGGGGFRAGALPIVLLATDTGFAYQPMGETTVMGVGGVSVPVSALTGTSRPTTPFSSGAGLQQTITGLNSLGALVIGLGTNAQSNIDPRQGLEAISRLTGAVNHSTTAISNGTAAPIAPGDPLYFQIASGFAGSVSNGVVSAIQNAVTNVAVDLTVQSSDPRVKIINHTGTRTGIGSGQSATFDIEFVGDGIPHRFDLQFVRAGSNVVVGSIPVVLGTPVPGDGYEFEDLLEGEIHSGVDFGSHKSTTVNQGPTDLILSSASVAENQPAGTLVGTLSTTDPDAGDTFTYTLVAGDVSNFAIVGNQLQTSTTFDFEAKASYSVTIRTTDAGGLFFDKAFTVSVGNVNEAPTDVILSSTSVAENQPAGTLVGTLSSTDPDAGDTFTYSLAAGDVSSFVIVGNQLQTATSFDFEAKSSYSVTIRTTDAGGLFFDKPLTISVSNVNEAPTDVLLSAQSVAENQAVGTLVGTLSALDPDLGDTFTFSLVSGDIASFTIVGDQLKTAAVFNYEIRSSYNVTVRAMDAGGLSLDKTFTITVSDLNEAPTDLGLSGASVSENQPARTVVGTFTTVDPDLRDSLTYSLVSGDVANFTIVDNQLQTVVPFDFEARSTYSVTVRTTDAGGLTFDKPFTISVINLNELPTDLRLSSTTVKEKQPAGTTVGTLSTTDPDAGDTFTYSLVSGDVSSFALVGNQLQTAAPFLASTRSSYTVTIRTTDTGGLSFDKVFTITVLTNGVAPTVKLPTNTVRYVENSDPVLINLVAQVSDPDANGLKNSVLTIDITSGLQPDDRLQIRHQGTGTNQIGVTGNQITFAGITIGNFRGGYATNSALIVTFNANATPASVAALLRNITFRNAGDNPTAATRTVRFVLTDSDGNASSPALRSVAVTPINDPPKIKLSEGEIKYTEKSPPVVIDGKVTVMDVDSPNYDKGVLRVRIATKGAINDRLSILNEGTQPGQIGLSSKNVLYGGVTIGSYVGGFTTNSDLVITFNANATPASVQALTRRIAYSTTGSPLADGTRAIQFTVTDGNGASSELATREIKVLPFSKPQTRSRFSRLLSWAPK